MKTKQRCGRIYILSPSITLIYYIVGLRLLLGAKKLTFNQWIATSPSYEENENEVEKPLAKKPRPDTPDTDVLAGQLGNLSMDKNDKYVSAEEGDDDMADDNN